MTGLGRSAFPGQRNCSYVMPHTASSGTRRELPAESGSRALSGGERPATDITARAQADLGSAVRRAVGLAEQELDDRPNMVTLRELAAAADGDPQAPVIIVVGQQGQTLARLRTAAVHFEDAATFFPVLGRWEVWQLIHLTCDTHPIQPAPRPGPSETPPG